MTEFNKIFLDLQPSQLPDEKDRNSVWNVGLINIQTPDMAVSLRIFHWTRVIVYLKIPWVVFHYNHVSSTPPKS